MGINVNEAIKIAEEKINEKKRAIAEAAQEFDSFVAGLDESGKSKIVALLIAAGALEKQKDGTLKETGKKISSEEAIDMLKKHSEKKKKKKKK